MITQPGTGHLQAHDDGGQLRGYAYARNDQAQTWDVYSRHPDMLINPDRLVAAAVSIDTARTKLGDLATPPAQAPERGRHRITRDTPRHDRTDGIAW